MPVPIPDAKGGGFKFDIPFLDKKYVCSKLKPIEEYAIHEH
jgi:hypothetical protein